MSQTCTSAGAEFEARAVLSFASRSSYDPWKTASTVMLPWLLLKLSTIRFSASPLMPPCACHQVIFAAGLTSLPGAFGPVSAAGPPPPPPVPPPQAAASKVSPSASAPSLRIFPSSGWPVTCHRTRRQLALRQPEQDRRRVRRP